MGLDNFWTVNKAISFDPPLKLCNMFIPKGGGMWFRGKVYETLILKVTGVSLYQELIENETVKAMAAKLQATPYDDAWGIESWKSNAPDRSETGMYAIAPEEYADLQRMFTVYAEAGASLEGSW